MTGEHESTAEAAVRKFLEFVADPASARDEALIATLRQQLGAAKDPIHKLKSLAALDRAEKSDGEALRHGFVLHARHWADQEAIPLSAFRELGVNDIVLAEAGFDLGMGRRSARVSDKLSARARGAGNVKTRARAKSVNAAEIRRWMSQQTEAFTLAQAMEGAGGSSGTVAKVAGELVKTGQLRRQGPSSAHSGRGRAPFQYARS